MRVASRVAAMSIATMTSVAGTGCGGGGGGNPSVATVDAPQAGNATPVAAPSEPSPTLSPVAAPENVVGVATLRSPGQLLDVGFGWSEVGIDWRAMLQTTPLGPLASAIDFDAPVDAIVTLDPTARSRPRFYGAASVGLTSRQGALDAFRAMDRPVEFVEPGVHAVNPDAQRTCFVTSALGQAPARLICANDRESLDRLSPYLSRGNPSSTTGTADVHVELRAEPAYRVFGAKAQMLRLVVPTLMAEVSVGDPAFDTALEDVATALVDDVILGLEDLANVRVDVSANRATRQLDASVSVGFRGQQSWLPRFAHDAAPRGAVAPEAFWRLPADATQATYQVRGNPEIHRSMREAVVRLAESGLAYLDASARTRGLPRRVLIDAWPQSTMGVSAQGPEPSSQAPGPNPDEAARFRATLGYTLIGVEMPLSLARSLMDDVLAAYEDASLRKALGKQLGLELKRLPKIHPQKGPKGLDESVRYRVDVPTSIDALEGDAGKSVPTVTLHALLAGDGERTWYGVSTDEGALEQRMRGVISGSLENLSSRGDLASLRSDRALLAGYWTPGGLARRAALAEAELAPLLEGLGDSPIVWRIFSETEGPKLRFQTRVPAELFRDLAAVAQALE